MIAEYSDVVERARSIVNELIAPVVDGDQSWKDAIQEAALRIAKLERFEQEAELTQ